MRLLTANQTLDDQCSRHFLSAGDDTPEIREIAGDPEKTLSDIKLGWSADRP